MAKKETCTKIQKPNSCWTVWLVVLWGSFVCCQCLLVVKSFWRVLNLFHPWARNCNTMCSVVNVVLQCINNVCYVCFICLLSMFTTVSDQFVTYFQLADPRSGKFRHNVKDDRRVCCKALLGSFVLPWKKWTVFVAKNRNMHKLLVNCLWLFFNLFIHATADFNTKWTAFIEFS